LLIPFIGMCAIAAAVVPNAFHIAGMEGIKRGQRVNVSLTTEDFVLENQETSMHVPYARIRQVLILHAARTYEKSTLAAAAASGAIGVPIGGLLILKKHKVDTIVIDYENDRHGRQGLVVQMERGMGQELGNRMRLYGVAVVDPPADPGKQRKAHANLGQDH
jgi:hypothetical protein